MTDENVENKKETAENETGQKEIEEQKKKEQELKIETEKNESKPPIKRRADFGKPHNFKSKPKTSTPVKKASPVKEDENKDTKEENENKELDIFNNVNKSDNQTYIYIGIFIVGMIALLPIIIIFLKKDDSTNTGNNPGWKPIS